MVSRKPICLKRLHPLRTMPGRLGHSRLSWLKGDPPPEFYFAGWRKGWCREGELNPQGAKHRRILTTREGSDPFGKFDFSTAYKLIVSIGSDWKCFVMSMELLQFYYSRKSYFPSPEPQQMHTLQQSAAIDLSGLRHHPA